ncbi:McrC family protein [Fuchsiella alkaliacetigena]|uniref:McrC family protein n=1 Tax=Fuchsiella alkaliacetigena TaxID=957042 RepID=UPI00200AF446|nr:McrC family protein [Fuchsiella alkaliacetigena]MCK8825247.1 McrC family protein [Fuchsiella alkaliacetigena]
MFRIDLVEYETSGVIDKELINEADRIFLSKLQYDNKNSQGPKIIIREEQAGVYFTAKNFVGVIKLSQVQINIFPRFDGSFSSLIQMILFCNGMNYEYYQKDIQSTEDNLNLSEIIVEFLLGEVRNITERGLFKEYVKYNRNLKVVRGRINIRKQLTNNFLRGDIINCNFEELDTDVVENKIILKALNIAKRITKNRDLLKEVNKYQAIFKQFCSELKKNEVPDIKYHRLNSYYEEAHLYSKLIIENIGTENIYTGKNSSSYSLLVNINDLFEEFVAQLFIKYLSNKYQIKAQKRITDAIVDKNSNRYRDIIPDLYFKNRKTDEVIIVDMKNKDYGEKKIQNKDIYQLSFYGMYFYDMFGDNSNLLIIYPNYRNSFNKESKLQLNTYQTRDNSPYIRVKGIDINMFLDLLKNEIKNREKIIKKLDAILI